MTESTETISVWPHVDRGEHAHRLVFWRGDFYLWQGTHWSTYDEEDVRADLYHTLNHGVYRAKSGDLLPCQPNDARVSNYLKSMKAILYRENFRDADDALTDRDHLRIAFRNGVLDRETGELSEHQRNFFNLHVLPFDYDPTVGEPELWLEFLDSIWGTPKRDGRDSQEARLLQEWFGYVLSGRTDLQRMMLLVGPTRAGKSVIASILGALVGDGAKTGISTSDLASTFGLTPLLGRSIAILADARFAGSGHVSAAAVENLLRIVGEDEISVNRKYRDPWEGRIGCRIMAISNELPAPAESSSALAKRFLVLQFRRSFFGKEDFRLQRKLRGELPAILLWALDGEQHLREAEHGFTEPMTSKMAVREIEELTSPVMSFMRECCENDPESKVNKDAMYRVYREWCVTQGRDRPLPKNIFMRNLYAAYSHLKPYRAMRQGERVQMIEGVRFSEDVALLGVDTEG